MGSEWNFKCLYKYYLIIERYIYFQEDEEPLEPDELPEHLREPPKIDMSKVDMSNPENLLQMSKKGRTLMMFVTISGNPTKEESETISKLWQTSLWNNHIQAERLVFALASYKIIDSLINFLSQTDT